MNINLDPTEIRAIPFSLLGLLDAYVLCSWAVLETKREVRFCGCTCTDGTKSIL